MPAWSPSAARRQASHCQSLPDCVPPQRHFEFRAQHIAGSFDRRTVLA